MSFGKAFSVIAVLACVFFGELVMSAPLSGICVLSSIGTSNVTGIVRFEEALAGRTVVVAAVRGLAPNTTHGFHIHEFGDISDHSQGLAVGLHYNPHNQPHSCPPVDKRHVGDMGNIVSNARGEATKRMTLDLIHFQGAFSIFGRSVIVHQLLDDCRTQPTGNSGARLAQCVIGICGTNCNVTFPVDINDPFTWSYFKN
jgi:Cu-Zn family superoxide dismutase